MKQSSEYGMEYMYEEDVYSIPKELIHNFLHGKPSVHHLAEKKLMTLFRKGPEPVSVYLEDIEGEDCLYITQHKDGVIVKAGQSCVYFIHHIMRPSVLIGMLQKAIDTFGIKGCVPEYGEKYKSKLLDSIKKCDITGEPIKE